MFKLWRSTLSVAVMLLATAAALTPADSQCASVQVAADENVDNMTSSLNLFQTRMWINKRHGSHPKHSSEDTSRHQDAYAVDQYDLQREKLRESNMEALQQNRGRRPRRRKKMTERPKDQAATKEAPMLSKVQLFIGVDHGRQTRETEARHIPGYESTYGVSRHAKVNVRVVSRPEWLKTTRCASAAPDSCEACTGANCWGMVPTHHVHKQTTFSLGLNTDEESSASGHRFATTIHVTCAIGSVGLVFKPRNLSGGVVRFFWDGTEINKVNGFHVFSGLESPLDPRDKVFAKNTKRTYKWMFDVDRKGGHDLTVEFVPDISLGKQGGIAIQGLSLWMPDEYTRCQDAQMCLAALGSTISGMRLRNDNNLQRICLEDGSTAPQFPSMSDKKACDAWLQCLQSGGDGQEQILKLLNAAGVGSTEQPADPNVGQHGGLCIHPPTADPEGWGCDCYAEMKHRCQMISTTPGFSEAMCIRAQFCMYPNVCDNWKNSHCNTHQMSVLQQALQDLASGTSIIENTLEFDNRSSSDVFKAFEMRSSYRHDAAANAQNLDGTLARGKRCK
eukprot:gnl/TRDRNA2_/TRDRNA2_177237_c0_seq1.p1 gnl/TRDRNA2_/TRDRNA2_177237_c0~~gnl/TRDRNA2_/TRDRNA2_177237_c0_seq1.p1  ORF type:complete len:561 (+),score=51.07 gnl/TRDRNA2_/TRDRNA2_177237_c0_seq1:96-1778(+)